MQGVSVVMRQSAGSNIVVSFLVFHSIIISN